MSKMLEEINSQFTVLNNTFDLNIDSVNKVASIIKNSKIKHIEIVARGSSNNASILFKYLLETNSNYRVSFVYPSTITQYQGTLNKDTIYIAISQGGRGVDLGYVMNKAKEVEAITIGVTNEEHSPLNKICEHNLYLKVNKEESMAATKTFTAEMLVLAMLVDALLDKDINEYKNVGELIKQINVDDINKLVNYIRPIKNLFVLTRGKLLGIAKEVCCKLQETCFINANAFATSDFLHGPFALVDESFYSLVLVPNDETKDDVINMINKIMNNNGKVIAIYPNGIKVNATIGIELTNVDNNKYPFLMTYVVQLLSAHLSTSLGRDPDKSRNLNKYTETI